MIYIVDHYDLGSLHNDHWRTTVPELIRASGLDVEIISGAKLITAVDDLNADIQYKISQSSKIYSDILRNRFKNGDIFIFTDAYNISSIILRQLLDMNGISNYRIIGVWREGVFDCNSRNRQLMLFKQKGYIRRMESAFYLTYDYSLYLHYAQMSRFATSHVMRQTYKMVATGYPIDIKSIAKQYDISDKQNIIVIPNRTYSRHVQDILVALRNDLREYEIINSCSLKLSRSEYYEYLRVAKYILTVTEEESDLTNVYEGMCFGCIPILPNTAVYKELMPSRYLYSEKVITAPLLNYIRSHNVIPSYVDKFDSDYDSARVQLEIDTEMIGSAFFNPSNFMDILNHEIEQIKTPQKIRRVYQQRIKKIQLRN